jgi:hypothetical protein
MLRIVWKGPRASQTLCFYWPRLSTLPTTGHVLSAHVHNLAQYVGLSTTMALQLELDVGATHARGMCSTEL